MTFSLTRRGLTAAGALPVDAVAADPVASAVEQVIAPLLQRYGIPGMAVGLVMKGRTTVCTHGLMSRATNSLVTDDTLFEIGSVSKTFTAVLGSYAQASGGLSLSGAASRYLPSLRGSSFDTVSLLSLGTHMSGGLALQVPDRIENDVQLMDYFRTWTPGWAPGTWRLYGNPGIGLLGMIAARRMNGDFTALTQGTVFPRLGMKHTFIGVPQGSAAQPCPGLYESRVPSQDEARIRGTGSVRHHGHLWRHAALRRGQHGSA